MWHNSFSATYTLILRSAISLAFKTKFITKNCKLNVLKLKSIQMSKCIILSSTEQKLAICDASLIEDFFSLYCAVSVYGRQSEDYSCAKTQPTVGSTKS